MVQITGNVFLILSLILHTATSSVWYMSAPLPSLYLPLPLPILLSARLELPPAVTSFYTINRLPVQRRSNPSRRQLELPPANVFQPGRATVHAPLVRPRAATRIPERYCMTACCTGIRVRSLRRTQPILGTGTSLYAVPVLEPPPLSSSLLLPEYRYYTACCIRTGAGTLDPKVLIPEIVEIAIHSFRIQNRVDPPSYVR